MIEFYSMQVYMVDSIVVCCVAIVDAVAVCCSVLQRVAVSSMYIAVCCRSYCCVVLLLWDAVMGVCV